MQLEALQRSIMAAIDHGPQFVEITEFVGGREAAMRGFSVHANTISHARLVALEETFPLTRALIGEEQFNAVSRDFVGTDAARSEPLTTVGRGFADCLTTGAGSDANALARFEWAWLESYHAAEAEPIALADFAQLDEAQLLDTLLARHPAARLAPVQAGCLLDEAIGGLDDAAALIITRPRADVAINPATSAMVHLFEQLAKPARVCNLLDETSELDGQEGLNALMALLNAGSVIHGQAGVFDAGNV